MTVTTAVAEQSSLELVLERSRNAATMWRVRGTDGSLGAVSDAT